MQNNINYIISKDTIILIDKGNQIIITKDNPEYQNAILAISENTSLQTVKENALRHLLGVGFKVNEDKSVELEGKPVEKAIAEKIVKETITKSSAIAYKAFCKKLQSNKDPLVQKYLATWIEQNGLAITKEGNLICLKAVNHDYYSWYSNKSIIPTKGIANKNGAILNKKVGDIIQLKEEDCNSNHNIECSKGLHIGGRSFVASFGNANSKYLYALVKPEHIRALPCKGMSMKARCVEYKILGFIPDINKATIDGVMDENIMDSQETIINKNTTDLEEAIIKKLQNGARTIQSVQKCLKIKGVTCKQIEAISHTSTQITIDHSDIATSKKKIGLTQKKPNKATKKAIKELTKKAKAAKKEIKAPSTSKECNATIVSALKTYVGKETKVVKNAQKALSKFKITSKSIYELVKDNKAFTIVVDSPHPSKAVIKLK